MGCMGTRKQHAVGHYENKLQYGLVYMITQVYTWYTEDCRLVEGVIIRVGAQSRNTHMYTCKHTTNSWYMVVQFAWNNYYNRPACMTNTLYVYIIAAWVSDICWHPHACIQLWHNMHEAMQHPTHLIKCVGCIINVCIMHDTNIDYAEQYNVAWI